MKVWNGVFQDSQRCGRPPGEGFAESRDPAESFRRRLLLPRPSKNKAFSPFLQVPRALILL